MSDIFTDQPSDAGGVSARQGFKFQDHVAAGFALQMIRDVELVRIECETADDILLVWMVDGREKYEYVQVKTTEGSSKYSKKEILRRDPAGSNPTSLAEKSLICDKYCAAPLFRIISKRDVNNYLRPLKIDRLSAGRANVQSIASDLVTKYKTNSPNDKNLEYWAMNLFWEVRGGTYEVKACNLQLLAQLADHHGANPTHPHCLDIYNDILGKVITAAEASSVTEAENKVLMRSDILDWWKEHLKNTSVAAMKSSKPYRITTDAFFVELELPPDSEFDPYLVSYDAQFERKKWRDIQMAAYLANWLPEIALKASELVGVDHLRMRQKFHDAVKRIENDTAVEAEKLLAETLLHSLLRHYNNSEPIACKIFYKSTTGVKSFANAHIIHGKTDELWLGRSELAKAVNFEDVVDAVMKGLTAALDTDFLKEERETILTLREPQHLLPTSLEKALRHNAPIDDLIAVLCIPILIAYESTVIGEGYSADYRTMLAQEIIARYQTLASKIPDDVAEIKLQVFLLPIENVEKLVQLFDEQMRGV